MAEGKSNGLIIDYIGIVKALRKALADYTANVGGGSTDPTIDKGELIERVLETIAAADEFLVPKISIWMIWYMQRILQRFPYY